MPQTREHVAILDLLGITNGVVALTKRDLVDDEWLDLVQADVEEFLEPTIAGRRADRARARPRRASASTRWSAHSRTCSQRERTRPNTGRPRLPIDRVFTVAGFGTVVTGTLIDGELHLGQELEVQPGGLRLARARPAEPPQEARDDSRRARARRSTWAALAVEDLRRGQVLAAPGTLQADPRGRCAACG